MNLVTIKEKLFFKAQQEGLELTTTRTLRLKKKAEEIYNIIQSHGPEAKNFDNSALEAGKVYEEAPYKKTSELPGDIINVMSKTLQKVWMDVFNKAYLHGEDYAQKAAWTVITKIAEKNKDDKWIKKKSKASLETSVTEAVTDMEYEPKDKATLEDIYTMKKIDFLAKRQDLLDKLLKEEKNETPTK